MTRQGGGLFILSARAGFNGPNRPRCCIRRRGLRRRGKHQLTVGHRCHGGGLRDVVRPGLCCNTRPIWLECCRRTRLHRAGLGFRYALAGAEASRYK